MKRRELYKRTIGYAIDGIGPVVFVSCFILPLYIFGAIMRPEKFLTLWIVLISIYVSAFVIIFVVYRKYFLDLLFCSTEKFCGTLYLGKELPPSSRAQASDLGRRWWMIEQKEAGKPLKFIIFPLIPENIHSWNLTVPDLRNGGIFTITYLKRSKCIVEIKRLDSPTYQPERKSYGNKNRKRK